MVLTIPISEAASEKLAAKAKAAGVDVATYAARHLELVAQSPRSLREISGPITEAFERSGMTEDKLADLLEAENHAMRAEKWAGHAE